MRLTGKDFANKSGFIYTCIYPESLLLLWSLLSETGLPAYQTQIILDKFTTCDEDDLHSEWEIFGDVLERRDFDVIMSFPLDQ